MRNNRISALIVLSISLFFVGFGLPKNLEKKVTKEIEKTFEITDFSMKPISISEGLSKTLPTKITPNNFFKVISGTQVLGYAFVDQAPSKTAKFDYLVIFDADVKVKHSKVLIYREEYGGEIGSKRWLSQFIGLTGGNRVDHETNIDGIAGATISVRSMTSAMDDLLQTIAILQQQNVL
ncbi:MAG: FMN-binding protein [Flavobacteriaceae bacterium]